MDDSDLLAIAKARRTLAASKVTLADVVTKARGKGYTWDQIGYVLGVSKQAARERFFQPKRK